jgi:hypothetical protein
MKINKQRSFIIQEQFDLSHSDLYNALAIISYCNYQLILPILQQK